MRFFCYNLYPYGASDFGGCSYDLTIRVDEAFSLEEGKEIRKDYTYYNCVPAAVVSFTIKSDFQDSDYMPFGLLTVSKDMIEKSYSFSKIGGDSIWEIYAGVDYTGYIFTGCDYDTGIGDEPKYVKITYIDDQKKREEKSVYIDIAK